IKINKKAGHDSLLIVNLERMDIFQIDNVENQVWHPHESRIALNIRNKDKTEIAIYDFRSGIEKQIITSSKNSFNQLQCSQDGNTLVFFEIEENPLIKHSVLTNEEHIILKASEI